MSLCTLCNFAAANAVMLILMPYQHVTGQTMLRAQKADAASGEESGQTSSLELHL